MSDLRDKLRRLGVSKGARGLKPARPLRPAAPIEPEGEDYEPQLDLEKHFPHGRLITNPYGAYFLIEKARPLSQVFGRQYAFGHYLTGRPEVVQWLLGDGAIHGESTLDHAVFLDIETNGFAGAGVFPFLVGLAFADLEQNALILHLYFSRDAGDESAMLHDLGRLLDQKGPLVTFNGRGFDLPLLDGRFRLNQIDLEHGPLQERPHIDLMGPTRRIWWLALSNRRLSTVADKVLGIPRPPGDVDSSEIPWIHRRYLQTKNPRPLIPIFIHNEADIYSMPILLADILTRLSDPDASGTALERLGLARWYLKTGRIDDGEAQLKRAIGQEPRKPDRVELLRELALIYKRTDRRPDAEPIWRELFQLTGDRHQLNTHVEVCVELAKYYEWHTKELGLARMYTEFALVKVDRIAHRVAFPQLEHRLGRLIRKMSDSSEPL